MTFKKIIFRVMVSLLDYFDLSNHLYRHMGCCASQQRYDPQTTQVTNNQHLQLAWNTQLFQAQNFVINGANIKLSAPKRKSYRIISKQAFPDSGKFQIKIRYVSQKNGSFSIGVVHPGTQLMTQNVKEIKNVGAKNAMRLYVSKNEGEFQSQGDTLFSSKDWRTTPEDIITMMVDMNAHMIDWKKQNPHATQTHKTPFPASFINKKLYLQLIMYEPDTQLNIQL